jgi:hypothetical protein
MREVVTGPLRRPIDVRFNPADDSAWILDFGEFEMGLEGRVIASPPYWRALARERNARWRGYSRTMGQTDEAERLLLTLKDDSNGGPVGLVLYWLCRGNIEAALERAAKAAELRFPTFITVVLRPFEPLLRQSAAWPGVLKRMNL